MEKSERETIINWNDADDYISVYTCHRGVMSCLDKMGLVPESKSRDGREYFVPRHFLAYGGKSIIIHKKSPKNKAKGLLKTPPPAISGRKLSKNEGLPLSPHKREK